MIRESVSHAILIADDDAECRSSLRDIFEPRGFHTYLAASGEEAIALVEVHAIDCLLLDMHMPDLNGLETLQIVRQVRASLPCIILTGDVSQQLVQRALSLHVFTVLPKPVSRELVTISVRRALRSIRHQAM